MIVLRKRGASYRRTLVGLMLFMLIIFQTSAGMLCLGLCWHWASLDKLQGVWPYVSQRITATHQTRPPHLYTRRCALSAKLSAARRLPVITRAPLKTPTANQDDLADVHFLSPS